MSDLVEFLRARLKDDERVAKKAAKPRKYSPWERARILVEEDPVIAAPEEVMMVQFHPDRMLREVEAKRAELDELLALPHHAWDGREEYGCPKYTDPAVWAELMGAEQRCTCGRDTHVDRMLRLKAQPHADHPDYLRDWAD